MSEELLADRYRRVASLGEGAMGEVWLADDLVLGRRVAIKQLRTNVAAPSDVTAVERMMREARTAARLHHPNVVSVHDLAVLNGQPYVIMEYVEGESLGERLRRVGALPMGEAAALTVQVAGALEAAHRLGIVHRDVKPANIMITDQGVAKLADFGIARARDEVGLTESGMLVGTLAYMAPELVSTGEPSPASDVWSLGATLFAAVEGHPPFVASEEDETSGRLVYRLMSEDAPPAAHAGAAAPLVARMLARQPADRPTAGEVGRRLATVGTPPAQPPPRDASSPTVQVPDAVPSLPSPTGHGRRSAVLALAAVALLVLAGVVAYVVSSGGSSPVPGHPSHIAGRPTGASTTGPSGTQSTARLPAGSQRAAFDDPAQVSSILTDTSNDITSLLTYDYRHLPQHDQQVRDLTTGPFRAQYATLFTKDVDPAVRHEKLSLTSTPVAVGVGPIAHADAVVLLVVDQTRTTGARPAAALSQTRVIAHVTEVGGRWLVAGLSSKGTITSDPPGTAGLSAALAASRTAVGLLVNLTDADQKSEERRLRALTTGPLAADFGATLSKLTAGARARGTRGTGKVVATAAATASGSRVTIVVSAYQLVRSRGAKTATRLHSQLRVTMTRSGGHWLVAGLTTVD